jgi:putative transposase
MAVRIHTRRLPHWESTFGVYFVTFRLADSLPRDVREHLRAEPKGTQLYQRKIQRLLDSGAGGCVLRNPLAAKIVMRALYEFEGSRYQLIAGCVMPNHVHVIFQVVRDWPLSKILFSWKSYTAARIKAALHLEGPLWQREYYDRLLRNSRELNAAMNYVVQNPARAGLKNWPWVFVVPESRQK